MAIPRKRKPIQRRTPRRSDAKATVEVIFEASARILRQGGRAALTTNRIAEVAGVSIGTLYGYFSNKEDILLAMAQRELDALRDVTMAGMRSASVGPLRGAIRALIRGYSEGGPVRRILMETLIATGRSADLARPVQQTAAAIGGEIAGFLPPGVSPPTEIGLYLLTRAIDGVIRTATYDAVPFLHDRAFEDEVVRLAQSYLAGTAQREP